MTYEFERQATIYVQHFTDLIASYGRQGVTPPASSVPRWFIEAEDREAAVRAWLGRDPFRRVCSEDGCEEGHYALGMCKRHYMEFSWDLRQ